MFYDVLIELLNKESIESDGIRNAIMPFYNVQYYSGSTVIVVRFPLFLPVK